MRLSTYAFTKLVFLNPILSSFILILERTFPVYKYRNLYILQCELLLFIILKFGQLILKSIEKLIYNSGFSLF